MSGLARTRPHPPARIVHLGLGAFSRSHTAWYTQHASDGEDWGISAYTGRTTDLARTLTAQDGLYTLVVRSAEGDETEVIETLVAAHAGGDLAALVADLRDPATAVVTLTITEAGYRLDRAGAPDAGDPDVRHDLDALAGIDAHTDLERVPVRTAIGRLVTALEARRRAGHGPLALVSCDNLPDNGALLGAAVRGLADALPHPDDWWTRLSFVSSSVDRITPRVSDVEADALRERFEDSAPVVAEPFRDWVLSGDFPAGRPRWEDAGARFTDDLAPWEARKLWLLNGAHSLLAALGQLRGHENVAQAIGDSECRAAVEAWWDAAEAQLPPGLAIAQYRRALVDRFSNPRIVHRLDQIALDGETKLRLRIVPVAERQRAAGGDADAAALAIAAWFVLQGSAGDLRGLIAALSEPLAADQGFVDAVAAAASALSDVTSG